MFIETEKRNFGQGTSSFLANPDQEQKKQWILSICCVAPSKINFLHPFGCCGDERLIGLCNLISEPVEKVKEIFVEAVISGQLKTLKVGDEKEIKIMFFRAKRFVCGCFFKLDVHSL